jgi:hypothetical protein
MKSYMVIFVLLVLGVSVSNAVTFATSQSCLLSETDAKGSGVVRLDLIEDVDDLIGWQGAIINFTDGSNQLIGVDHQILETQEVAFQSQSRRNYILRTEPGSRGRLERSLVENSVKYDLNCF